MSEIVGPKWRDVRVGRLVLLQGDHVSAGKTAVIVEIVDHKRFLVDGPASSEEASVPRQVVPATACLLTDIVIPVPRAARTGTVRKAWEKAEVDAKWKNTAWAKRQVQNSRRKALTDFERFSVMRLKKQRRFEQRKALVQVKASA